MRAPAEFLPPDSLPPVRLAAKRLGVYLGAKAGIPRPLRGPLEKLRQATRGLPSHVTANARMADEVIHLSEVAKLAHMELIASAETIRASIIQAGGTKPRVKLRVPMQKTFTVDAPKRILASNDFHKIGRAHV